jgi:mannose-6-phosphate isomerase-like protein (cupin superfamily)
MAPASGRADYQNVLVKKPWGCEYLVYDNGLVSLWHLFIRNGERTSMHCHPSKKTSLILLSGEAVVSFLTDSRTIHSLAKMMIREGLFHSTAALSSEGIIVLETETPSDKTNLVRLEDEYGRQEKPYEGSEAVSPLTEDCIRLSHPQEGRISNTPLAGCTLSMEKLSEASPLIERPPGEVIVVLEGGLFSRTGDPVLSVGDVVSSETVSRLAKTFFAPHGVSFLAIRKNE